MGTTARLLSLLIALAAAFMISYLVFKKSSTKHVVVQDKPQGLVSIAVAAKDIPRGSKITVDDLKMVPFFKESLPAGNFTEKDKVVGRVVLKAIGMTEPVLESSLAPTDLTRGGMAAIITPEKRAMSIKVDDVVGVAGFIQPGHLVDVLVSVDRPDVKDAKSKKYTKTVLENIPVLSIGTQAEVTDDKKAKRVTVVTLEVTLEEGEQLALATHDGRIQLALRGYTDEEVVQTTGSTMPTLLKSYALPEKKRVSAGGAPVRRYRSIEIINGNKIDRIVTGH